MARVVFVLNPQGIFQEKLFSREENQEIWYYNKE